MKKTNPTFKKFSNLVFVWFHRIFFVTFFIVATFGLGTAIVRLVTSDPEASDAEAYRILWIGFAVISVNVLLSLCYMARLAFPELSHRLTGTHLTRVIPYLARVSPKRRGYWKHRQKSMA